MKTPWIASVLGLAVVASAATQEGSRVAEPRLPHGPGELAPAFVRAEEGESIDAAVLMDVDTCAACHADVVRQWRSSAHALASFNNPYYRTAVDRFREQAGFEVSQFCAGCHDIALLPDGGMLREIDPGDPRAHAGITCATCHGIVSTAADGNGSYTLTTRPIPLPVVGSPASLAAHRLRVAPDALRTQGLCISCHRGFLGPETTTVHFMIGMDDGSDWQRSSYAATGVARMDDPMPAGSCTSCHMPSEDGRRSHRFPGAHTALAEALEDEVQLERVTSMLESAATLDIAAVRDDGGQVWLLGEGVPLEAGRTLTFDVVVRNTGVGHRFPGGTLDLQDTWIEVEARDGNGRLLAEAGTRHAESGADPTAHRLVAVPVDDEGVHEPFHVVSRFVAVAWNHTIQAREAAVSRYRLRLDQDHDALTVTARLRHRRHHLTYAAAVCEDAISERGQAFSQAVRAQGRPEVEVCEPDPVVTIAEAELGLGPDGASAAGERPGWRRLYDHALGLMGHVQEHLDEARPSLERAWSEVRGSSDSHAQAMVLVLQAELEGLQGRTEQALLLLDRAEALSPGHPAIDFRRGEALAAVWRWEEAAASYQRVVDAVPHSDVARQRLAVALSSLDRSAEALAVADGGLRLQPRDSSLLLSQALALDALGAPAVTVRAAREAYLRHRPYDGAPRARLLCFQRVEGCATERVPVHVHEMRGVP